MTIALFEAPAEAIEFQVAVRLNFCKPLPGHPVGRRLAFPPLRDHGLTAFSLAAVLARFLFWVLRFFL
jgi:hypothetical protein